MRPYCTAGRRTRSVSSHDRARPEGDRLGEDVGTARLGKHLGAEPPEHDLDAARLEREVVLTLDASRATLESTVRMAAHDDRSAHLRALVAWYERVAGHPSTTEQPPLEGLDALADELTSAIEPERLWRLAAARWAVRLAEELVRLRRWRHASASTAMARLATSRLSQTLRAARLHLAQEPPERP